tara:strand:+ start:2385 stop:2564 length:180 start_codon:yes stop_codon:yes gene_type:complete
MVLPSNIRLRQANNLRDTGGGPMKSGNVPRIGKSLHSFLLLPRTGEKNCGCKTFKLGIN